MTDVYACSIGTPGKKWDDEHRAQWLAEQTIKRSYQDEVLSKIESLKALFEVEQYGALAYNLDKYPLFVMKSRDWDNSKATILVTGGVHGYETSGVQGAIRFAQTKAESYLPQFNLLIAPCLSPWGYETINRWNPGAIDPNRSFVDNSPAPESAALMAYVQGLGLLDANNGESNIVAHFDLHETTDSDNTEFRPALAARDAETHDNWDIPDGFYLVGDNDKPQDNFQQAMIEAVKQVTHIAPADKNDEIIGSKVTQFGVINYPTKALGLCAGFTDAAYVTTTEVYPDSPKVDDENCIVAQVAAITSGIDYIIDAIAR